MAKPNDFWQAYIGFDILMSQKIQVENNLAFECCAKMV